LKVRGEAEGGGVGEYRVSSFADVWVLILRKMKKDEERFLGLGR